MREMVENKHNDSTTAVVNDVMGKLAESLNSYFFIIDDHHSSLIKSVQYSEHKHHVLEDSLFIIVT